MLSWNDEMDNMLAAIDRQVKYSLKNIKMAFKCSGLSFDAEFKHYLVRALNNRIKESCDQFEIISMLEDKVSPYAEVNTSATDEYQMFSHGRNCSQHEINGPVEIIDSSDKEDQAGNWVEMQFLETPSTIHYDDHDMPPEFNDGDQLNEDGSYDEKPNMNSNNVDCRKGIPKNAINFFKKSLGKAMTPVDGEVNNGIPLMTGDVPLYPGLDAPKKRTVTLNHESKILRCAKSNKEILPNGKVTGRSTRYPGKETENYLKTAIVPNQLKMKKCFKCIHCEYSCKSNSDIKKHMRTHTGEKPYRCDICHKGFTIMRNMKRHQVTHTNETPFHCRGCFTGFYQEVDQEDHEKVCKHRRYECHICKKFVTSDKHHFQRHMRTHNGEKPFRCEICTKCFTRNDSLKTHLDTIHTNF